jgi:uncharacterized protein
VRRTLSLDQIRTYAVARSLFEPTTLRRAISQLGFVQADPIRAPARAQDLTLRHRVNNYRAGDLERRYRTLDIEEAHYLNYGFLPRRHVALMFPREERRSRTSDKLTNKVLAFVRARGEVHPAEVERHFAHGAVTNAWGGSSSATTQILSTLHYRGALRVAGREKGIRLYAPAAADEATLQGDAITRAWGLLSLAVAKYAPLPLRSIGQLASRLVYAAPQLTNELKLAAKRMATELPHATVDNLVWYWPSDEDPFVRRNRDPWTVAKQVRLLAPFDPVVWDRTRFSHLWGWDYRFEAYTPVSKRKLGYYALPLLWGARVIGWANVAQTEDELDVNVGYVTGTAPKGRNFKRELEAEIERMRTFLGKRRAAVAT